MSAINVLRQRKSVHLITDMAAYDRAGVLASVDHRKCVSMPTMRAAVACTGPAMLGHFFAGRLPRLFESFDSLVKDANACLPALFDEYAKAERGGNAASTLYLIGWHEKQRRPAAYAMDMWTSASSRIEQVLANSPNADKVRNFRLEEQLVAGTPLPGPDLCAQAGFVVPDDENDMIPERDLLHLLEVQRHERIEGAYWVGGGAWLTSVDRQGVKQRVIHRWEEDHVGEVITPRPIDWRAWSDARDRRNDHGDGGRSTLACRRPEV